MTRMNEQIYCAKRKPAIRFVQNRTVVDSDLDESALYVLPAVADVGRIAAPTPYGQHLPS